MKHLLQLAGLIDRINQAIGRAATWLILVMVLISAGNAIMRKAFNMSSNGWLEIQWSLFAAVFLLAAAYTLLKNEHVRIDLLSSRLGPRAQAWIDIFGTLFFLLPLCALILFYAWPFFWESFTSQEWSSNPGGLILWPAKSLIPICFALLALQGVSEIIKRIGFLLGMAPPTESAHVPSEHLAALDSPEKSA
jgi:TRAP-type mannitol/chloroaromatic compound transport system permease small subunit